MGKELVNFRFSHLRRMAFVVKENESLDPLDVSFFRAVAVMLRSNRRAHSVQQLWLMSLLRSATIILYSFLKRGRVESSVAVWEGCWNRLPA
jgi:hypothetical protein